MGRTVAPCFFIGHRLRKNRSDPGFSVQATELAGIFPEKEVRRLHSIIAENNFLKGKSQLLPNHHIVHLSNYIIPQLESQLLPNGSIWDDVQDIWVELESQLLPNRHTIYMAKDGIVKCAEPNVWCYEMYVAQCVFEELEDDLGTSQSAVHEKFFVNETGCYSSQLPTHEANGRVVCVIW